MRTHPVLPLAFCALLSAQFVRAQEPHQHHTHSEEHLGDVNFPISCDVAVHDDFNRAVATLHSFGYEEARELFEHLAEMDPLCGMAWWGIAMTYYHPLWAPPLPAEIAAGSRAAEMAAQVGARTDRESKYIDAIDAFYFDYERMDHRTRAVAYRNAMEALTTAFPDDGEARIFYALSILAVAPPVDISYSEQKRSAGILNDLLPEMSRHPGLAHYTIHAFDHPALAELALPAARAYADIAPASAHARHMPSHIFIRLGLWEESIATNLNASAAARERISRSRPGAHAYEDLHVHDYLAYAYLQLGQDDEARMVLEEVRKAREFDVPNFAIGYALEAVPARFALERRDWKAAADLKPPDVDLPWEAFLYARAITHFANGIGSARLGNVERAKESIEKLEAIRSQLSAQPPAGPYDWSGQVESLRLAIDGWLAFADRLRL